MKNVKRKLCSVLGVGQAAGIATAATAAACGQLENGNAIAPLNAMSHIVWGEGAAEQEGFSLKYTLAGVALCSSAMAGWAALYERLFGHAADEGETGKALGGAALVAATAYLVDYVLAPERLTPGLEHRLSRRSIVTVYIVLAAVLALGGLTRRKAR